MVEEVSLRLGIDASPAKAGTNDFKRSADDIIRSAEDIKRKAAEMGRAVDRSSGSFRNMRAAANDNSRALDASVAN